MRSWERDQAQFNALIKHMFSGRSDLGMNNMEFEDLEINPL